MGKIDLNLDELEEITWCLTLINRGKIYDKKTMTSKLYHKLVEEQIHEKDLLDRDKLHAELNED